MPRWFLFIRLGLAVLIGLCISAIAFTYVRPFLESKLGSPESSGFAGAIAGLIPLISSIATYVFVRPKPDISKEASRICSKQRESTGRLRTQLRMDLAADIRVTFRNATNNEFDIDDVTKMILTDSGRVVVVGRPGSGKSYSAYNISYKLLMSKENEAKNIVCPVISVSRWDPCKSLDDWLTEYLQREFSVSAEVAKYLVSDHRVIPIFDGLDEAEPRSAKLSGKLQENDDATHAATMAQLLEALLAWSEGVREQRFLITSERGAWEQLPHDVREDARLVPLRVAPLSATATSEYFAAALRDPDSIELAHRAVKASRLADISGTPWGVAMIAKVIQLTAAAEPSLRVDDHPLLSADRHDLVKSFVILNATPKHGLLKQYRTRATLRKLGHYARFLKSNMDPGSQILYTHTLSSRDIVLHRLWPIAGRYAPRICDFTICILLTIPALALTIWITWDLPWVSKTLIILAILMYMVLLARTSLKPWVRVVSFNWSSKMELQPLLIQTVLATIGGVVTWYIFGPMQGILTFISAWLVVGFTVGMGQTLATGAPIRTIGPETILKRDLLVSRLSGISAVPLFWGLCIVKLDPLTSIVFAAVYGVVTGNTVASALWRRYISTILVAGHRIGVSPRLVLRRALKNGLMRSRGLSYQFRHDDVRDYLASRSQ